MPDPIEEGGQAALDLETEGDSGEQSEQIEQQRPAEPVKIMGRTEAEWQKLEEQRIAYEQRLRQVDADEEYQRIQQARAEQIAREQAEVAAYEQKRRAIAAEAQKAETLAQSGRHQEAELAMLKAMKLQRELEAEPAQKAVQTLLSQIPTIVQQQVMEMLKPNLLGQYIESEAGTVAPGVGQKVAEFRNLLMSGKAGDNELAQFVKDIVGLKGKATTGNQPRLRAMPGGLGLEDVNDNRDISEDADFEKALAARRKRLLQGRG